MAVGRAIA